MHSTFRLRSVRSALQPFGKFLEIHFQLLTVVTATSPRPRLARLLSSAEVSHAQCFQVVDVVQGAVNRNFLSFPCCLTYPLQRTERVVLARCPGRVLLWQVPFGQTPSRHSPPPPVVRLCSETSQVSGRRRRAVRRWPPSAAQTARAVLPHAAFTKA